MIASSAVEASVAVAAVSKVVVVGVLASSGPVGPEFSLVPALEADSSFLHYIPVYLQSSGLSSYCNV